MFLFREVPPELITSSLWPVLIAFHVMFIASAQAGSADGSAMSAEFTMREQLLTEWLWQHDQYDFHDDQARAAHPLLHLHDMAPGTTASTNAEGAATTSRHTAANTQAASAGTTTLQQGAADRPAFANILAQMIAEDLAEQIGKALSCPQRLQPLPTVSAPTAARHLAKRRPEEGTAMAEPMPKKQKRQSAFMAEPMPQKQEPQKVPKRPPHHKFKQNRSKIQRSTNIA